MKKLTKIKEEIRFEDPRKKCVDLLYVDEDGKEIERTFFRSAPSVAIIVYKDGKIAFIRQHRLTTDQWYIELPAGGLKPGETETDAAIRETLEETGLTVENVRVLVKGPSLLDPSKSDENYGVVVADVCGERTQILDSDEQIDSKLIWIEEAEVYERMRAQLFEGKKFFDDLFLSGHSLYALMAFALS